jgi:hypothetical protein
MYVDTCVCKLTHMVYMFEHVSCTSVGGVCFTFNAGILGKVYTSTVHVRFVVTFPDRFYVRYVLH